MITRRSSTKSSPLSNMKLGERASRALPFLLLLLVGVFILYPMIMLLVTSFDQEGAFTFSGYASVFSSSSTYKALLNTLQMEVGVLFGACFVGGSLAFLRHKTDYKSKHLLDIFVFLNFTIPAYILSVSWIQVAARNGYLRRILKVILPNVQYNYNAYSIGACIIILVLHVYPLVYFGVGNALKLLGNSYEQSAKVCGASKTRIIFRVILPLVLPAFISTGLLVVSRTLANFGVPAQLAMPIGKEVLTTRLYSAMADLNLPVVAVYALLLVVISLGLFLVSERVLKKRVYDSEDLSKDTEIISIKLGKWQGPIRVITGIFFTISILIPFLTIIVTSLFKCWGLSFEMKHLTFQNYVRLFTEEKLLTRPLLNSLIYGIIAATTAVMIASLIVYFYQYKHNRVANWLMSISQLPIAIPNIILAVAAMVAWINEPFKLYGTASIIVVTYTVLFIPICIKQMLGAAKNIDRSMDKAAQTMGIPVTMRYARLFLPQIKDSLISGFLICFLISLKEIPISLLLYSAGTKTLGVMLFSIQSNAYGLEMTSSVAVIVIALSVTGNLILNKLGARGYQS